MDRSTIFFKIKILHKALLFLLFVGFIAVVLGKAAHAQTNNDRPRVLLVTAHPDDDALFSATVFKINHLLEGITDLAIITNGEGGYNYSTLGEYFYDTELDTEEAGRSKLPGIRKMEVMRGGNIVGIRNYYFLDQVDDKLSQDISSPFNIWDIEFVRQRLKELMITEAYDYVFVMLLGKSTHAHHKVSSLLALQTVQEIELSERPIVLGGSIRAKSDTTQTTPNQFDDIKDTYPVTRLMEGVEPLEFDRTQTFGKNNRLNYKIVVNWVIAEHKSQGTMQLLMNGGDVEQYWYFDINGAEKYKQTARFFKRINRAKIYDDEQ